MKPPKPLPPPPSEAEKIEDKGGPSVAFDPFIINLNEPKSNRYLKATSRWRSPTIAPRNA